MESCGLKQFVCHLAAIWLLNAFFKNNVKSKTLVQVVSGKPSSCRIQLQNWVQPFSCVWNAGRRSLAATAVQAAPGTIPSTMRILVPQQRVHVLVRLRNERFICAIRT